MTRMVPWETRRARRPTMMSKMRRRTNPMEMVTVMKMMVLMTRKRRARPTPTPAPTRPPKSGRRLILNCPPSRPRSKRPGRPTSCLPTRSAPRSSRRTLERLWVPSLRRLASFGVSYLPRRREISKARPRRRRSEWPWRPRPCAKPVSSSRTVPPDLAERRVDLSFRSPGCAKLSSLIRRSRAFPRREFSSSPRRPSCSLLPLGRVQFRSPRCRIGERSSPMTSCRYARPSRTSCSFRRTFGISSMSRRRNINQKRRQRRRPSPRQIRKPTAVSSL
mmetsp:Transcript_17147/g.49185  ORF Transcript_17147/g.49185 Transcript_17147/m.49185 type:complete len:276 (+) Transcript_17147:197-1024(+)